MCNGRQSSCRNSFAHHGATEPLGVIEKTLTLLFLSTKNLDDFVRIGAFFNGVSHRADRLEARAAGSPNATAEAFDGERHHRANGQSDERQLPSQVEQIKEKRQC